AGFAILLPEQLGRPVQSEGFGLAQLSFIVAGSNPADGPAFGNVFGTAGIPIHEFVRHAPFARKSALRLLRVLLPAMLIGNCFLPGEFSKHRLLLKNDGTLLISGSYHDEMAATMASVRRR